MDKLVVILCSIASSGVLGFDEGVGLSDPGPSECPYGEEVVEGDPLPWTHLLDSYLARVAVTHQVSVLI